MVHYILRRRQQQGEYHGLIREADAVSQPLLYIFEDFIAEVLAELGPHLWRQRNNFRVEWPSFKVQACLLSNESDWSDLFIYMWEIIKKS